MAVKTLWFLESQKNGFRSYTNDLPILPTATEVNLNLKIMMCSYKGLKDLRHVVNQLARMIISHLSSDLTCMMPPNGDGWPIEIILTYNPNDDNPAPNTESAGCSSDEAEELIPFADSLEDDLPF